MTNQVLPDDSFARLVDSLLQRGPAAAPSQHATKLSRSLHSGRIASALREGIVDGGVPPGTSLVETRLAAALGVSRGPIRSALHVLEGEGLVVTKPNGRMVAVGFSTSDLKDLFDVRYRLEGQAIQMGLARKLATDAIDEAFRELVAEGNSTSRLPDLDVRFHRALLRFSGSRFLEQAWTALAPLIHTVITIGNRRLAEQDPRENFARIVASHRNIVDALGSGKADAALEMLAGQFDLSRSMFGAAESERRGA